MSNEIKIFVGRHHGIKTPEVELLAKEAELRGFIFFPESTAAYNFLRDESILFDLEIEGAMANCCVPILAMGAASLENCQRVCINTMNVFLSLNASEELVKRNIIKTLTIGGRKMSNKIELR